MVIRMLIITATILICTKGLQNSSIPLVITIDKTIAINNLNNSNSEGNLIGSLWQHQIPWLG